MTHLFGGNYYDFFSRRATVEAPTFEWDKNYLMRFKNPLDSYTYENNNLTIVYFKEGHGGFELENRYLPVDHGSFIITNPGKGWNYMNERKKSIDVLSIVVSQALLNQFYTFHTKCDQFLIDYPYEVLDKEYFFMEMPLRAKHYTSGRVLESLHRKTSYHKLDHLDMEEIVIEVLFRLQNDQLTAYKLAKRIKSKKHSTKIEVFKRLLLSREYIHDNLNRPIPMGELANISCLPKFHLYDSFKRVFGQTPHQYANAIKLMKSKELLASGEYMVNEVSDLLGFNDIQCFSKLFKKHYRISPSQFKA